MRKNENIVLMVDKETKKFFQKMIDLQNMSLTSLILELSRPERCDLTISPISGCMNGCEQVIQ